MLIACGLSAHDRESLSASAGTTVTLFDDLSAVLHHLLSTPEETVLILGPELPAHEAAHYAARSRSARTDAVVVLLRAGANRLERSAAHRAGVDVVLSSSDLAAAGRACGDILLTRAEQGHGRMVTVFAAKGGCGKTTIAVNLALALAAHGSRRVALVDLDLHQGDIAATLGLPSERTLAAGTSRDGDVRAMVSPLRPGLDCILAPVRPGEAERLEGEGVDETLSALTRRYDVVVVDTPGTFTRPVLSALDRSDHHILVTTPERPALQSLRRTLDTIDLLGHRRDSRHVVFNRSDSGVGITAQDVERMLRAPIAAHVPSSRDVAASINTCAPLMVSSPDHPVSSAIRGFALARLVSPATAPRPVHGGAMT
jgi:MinD-like ATPase involved in chromosome partitioning or flagellar assembly